LSAENIDLGENLEAEIRSRGLDPGTVRSQIETFRKGVKHQELARPCTLGDGIETVADNLEHLSSLFDQSCQDKNVIKFVPASGAASRMFRELQAVLTKGSGITQDALQAASNAGDKESSAALKFIEGIKRYAFYPDLASSLESSGIDIEALLQEGDYKHIISHTLGEPGLNYSHLPKGIIKFHLYGNYARTAFEEHLVEAAHYSLGSGGIARMHFTLSPEHEDRVKSLITRTKALYEKEGASIEVSYSVQKPSTDTIAVDMDNRPFINADGSLLLRPGGHGALIENLNDLECDMVFIKNIDNVVPDRIKPETYSYKKALGGYLFELEQRVFGLLRELDSGYSEKVVHDALAELSGMGLVIELPEYLADATETEKAMYIRARLMSPIRVCGVVRNQGEPGGGPFWVRGVDGALSKQIVESSQVDMANESQKAVWQSSTHFNPVDLVCSVRDYQGKAFDLTQYIDRDAGFISHKSSGGRELKALELPGLWNGAMAYWNTVFVEVPLITFNPVKTVLDLLRPEHQNP
jgi:uncharacterized protein DUF4301